MPDPDSPSEPAAALDASNTGRTLRSIIVIGALTVAAKLCVAARDLLLARSFGTSGDSDTFLIALIVPLFAVNVFSGALNSAAVPYLVRVRAEEDLASMRRLIRGIA